MLVYRLYRTLVFVVLLLGVMDALLVLYGWVAHGSLDMTSHVSVLLFFGALMLFLVVRMRWVGQIAQALNDNPSQTVQQPHKRPVL